MQDWQQWLKQAAEEFGMQLAIISSIEGNKYTVLHTYSDLGLAQAGDQFETDATYCFEVVKKQQVQAFAYIGGMPEMCLHPCYQALHLESYLGVPLVRDGEFIGTLNFTSLEPRASEFTEQEKRRAQELAEQYLAAQAS